MKTPKQIRKQIKQGLVNGASDEELAKLVKKMAKVVGG